MLHGNKQHFNQLSLDYQAQMQTDSIGKIQRRNMPTTASAQGLLDEKQTIL